MSENHPHRGFTTAILHSDRDAPIEHGALHKPLHLSVAYGYRNAADLIGVFQGRQAGYAYGRQGNPTSAALEAKVNAMEDGVATACFATGMAAAGITSSRARSSSVIRTACSQRSPTTARPLRLSMRPASRTSSAR
jgi:O-acetylhomoserine (thiol)-lyase